MTTSEESKGVHEAVGIFFDEGHLKAAIEDLESEGFGHDEIGLLASEYAVEQALGELYTRTNRHENESQGPVTAFVRDYSVGDTFRSLEGGLFIAGSTAALGVAVASAGVLGGALVAAVGSAAAVGAGPGSEGETAGRAGYRARRVFP